MIKFFRVALQESCECNCFFRDTISSSLARGSHRTQVSLGVSLECNMVDGRGQMRQALQEDDNLAVVE
eukprot:SAG31_NODE_29_length_32663_cov_14.779695_11_plen_68_part_00